MGIVAEIMKLKTAKDVTGFRKEKSSQFFINFVKKLKEFDGWDGLEEIEKSLKSPKGKEWKYKSLVFEKPSRPGKTNARKIEDGKTPIDYFFLHNKKISEKFIDPILEETDADKKCAHGIGLSILKTEKQIEFRIGLQGVYGKNQGSAGREINRESEKEGYQKTIKFTPEEDDNTIINIIAKEFIDILDKIGKELVELGENKEKNSRISPILTALSTKPFLILAGVSGTGKTQIARIVAGVMAGKKQ